MSTVQTEGCRGWMRFLAVIMACALVDESVSAGTILLSQTTTGLNWVPGEAGFRDYVDFSTSGGPSGAADSTLVLEVTAPDGQLFSLDGGGYASESGIDFEFRPIITFSVSNGVTLSQPTFSLIGASGVSVGAAIDQSTSPHGGNQVYLSTTYPLSGVGTFAGFRMTVAIGGSYAGQSIVWEGGDASARNAEPLVSLNPSEIGPVLAMVSVPEPSTCAMALVGLASSGYSMFRRRQRI